MDQDRTDPGFGDPEWTDPRIRPRWRVLLVRLPAEDPAAVEALLPTRARLSDKRLPRVVRITDDPRSAQDTAHVLRRAGAAVIVVEEPELAREGAFCRAHTNELAALRCQVCSAPICHVCQAQAREEPLCREHAAEATRVARNQRARQLFLLFLLSVVLFSANQLRTRDQAAVDPRGTVRVAVLQFALPGSIHTPLVRQLNGLGEGAADAATDTLAEIAPFLDRERARYMGSQGKHYELDIRGPWLEALEPPELATPDDNAFTILWRSLSFARYFEQLAKDKGIDLDDYAAQIFVVYGPERGDLAAHSRGSEKRRIAIAYIADNERNPAYAVLTVAHELAHTLGAPDNYDPDTMSAQYPVGFVEPFARPLYPQRFAELMAVDRPMGADLDVEIRSMDEVRIGHLTAASMGWIDPEKARLYYQPSGVQPEDLLDEPPLKEAL